MGSSSASISHQLGETANIEVPFDDDRFREDFVKIDGGLMKNANLLLVDAISDAEGQYKVVADPKFLRKRKATPHSSASTHNNDDKKKLSTVDMFFAQRFKELELELKAKQVQVPVSVTEGNVAGLIVVVSAEGKPVFKPGLEEHVREQTK